jgi:hypothetical protein
VIRWFADVHAGPFFTWQVIHPLSVGCSGRGLGRDVSSILF